MFFVIIDFPLFSSSVTVSSGYKNLVCPTMFFGGAFPNFAESILLRRYSRPTQSSPSRLRVAFQYGCTRRLALPHTLRPSNNSRWSLDLLPHGPRLRLGVHPPVGPSRVARPPTYTAGFVTSYCTVERLRPSSRLLGNRLPSRFCFAPSFRLFILRAWRARSSFLRLPRLRRVGLPGLFLSSCRFFSFLFFFLFLLSFRASAWFCPSGSSRLLTSSRSIA